MTKFKIDILSIEMRMTALDMTPADLYRSIGISRRTWQIIRSEKEATYPVITAIAYELGLDPFEHIIIGSNEGKQKHEKNSNQDKN